MTATAIIIDSREPDSITGLDFGGLPKHISMLDCGDAWIATDSADAIIVERKTADDLLGSIRDGRLFAQAAAMRERSPWAYVVITTPLAHHSGKVVADGRSTGWAWESVQGALLDVQEMGVRVLYCRDENDYADTLLRLANRKRTEEKIIPPAAPPRLMSHAEQLLTALPGVGIERAQDLLKNFPRSADALTWLTWQDTVLTVAGIGKGTKSAVRRALGLADDEELFVMTPPDYRAASTKLNGHTKTAAEKQAALPIERTYTRDPKTGELWA